MGSTNMNALKKITAAVGLAALGFAVTPAMAATVANGQTFSEVAEVVLGSASLEKTFSYTFTGGVTKASFIFDFADTGSKTQGFSVTGVSYANLTGGSTFDSFAEVWGTNYTFNVNGNNTLSALTFTVKLAPDTGATFDSNTSYSMSVTAVPEPESYAMLLAGLGLVGTMIRRRSKSV
jgi:hypothetical protein